MVLIKISDFPEFLKKSELYLSFENSENLDEEVEIPEDKLSYSNIINTLEDFIKLVDCIGFFGLDVTQSIIDYYIHNSKEIIEYYLIQKKDINDNLELRKIFLFLVEIELPIKFKSYDQFISNYVIILLYDIYPPENIINYVLKYKNKFLGYYYDFYEENKKLPPKFSFWGSEDDYENFSYKEFIISLYCQLNDYERIVFDIDISKDLLKNDTLRENTIFRLRFQLIIKINQNIIKSNYLNIDGNSYEEILNNFLPLKDLYKNSENLDEEEDINIGDINIGYYWDRLEINNFKFYGNNFIIFVTFFNREGILDSLNNIYKKVEQYLEKYKNP